MIRHVKVCEMVYLESEVGLVESDCLSLRGAFLVSHEQYLTRRADTKLTVCHSQLSSLVSVYIVPTCSLAHLATQGVTRQFLVAIRRLSGASSKRDISVPHSYHGAFAS